MSYEDTDTQPFCWYSEKQQTLFVWSGIYGENVGMLVRYDKDDYESTDEFEREFDNRSTMVENDHFRIDKPPFEFKERFDKNTWFIERCMRNWVNPLDENNFDTDGIAVYPAEFYEVGK